MTAYHKLAGESFDFDFEEISKSLKVFTAKIKSLNRSHTKSAYKEAKSLQKYLQEIFSRPRLNLSDRTRLETLENQFKQINSKLQKMKVIEPSYETEKIAKKSDELQGIVECHELAVQDEDDLRARKYNERNANLLHLHQEMAVVNNLFKDTATMVEEHGIMLEVVEENIYDASKQTEKAHEELVLADQHQKSARSKISCIFMVTFILVLALIAILMGTIYLF